MLDIGKPGQAGDPIPSNGGSVEVYGGRGIWVPEGMTAAEIVLGGRAVEDRYDLDKFTARSIVMTVLETVRAAGFPGTCRYGRKEGTDDPEGLAYRETYMRIAGGR